MQKIDHYAALAERIVDLSADFRLRLPEEYVRWYGKPTPTQPGWKNLSTGCPNCTVRDRGARYINGVGCNATATNLAIYPLFAGGLADSEARGHLRGQGGFQRRGTSRATRPTIPNGPG